MILSVDRTEHVFSEKNLVAVDLKIFQSTDDIINRLIFFSSRLSFKTSDFQTA